MKRPIIFSGPMVTAILRGEKSQTRRVMKPQPSEGWEPHSYGDVHKMLDGEFLFRNEEPVLGGWGPSSEDGMEAHPCPFGKPGDRLWVREAWCGTQTTEVFPFEGRKGSIVAYRATYDPERRLEPPVGNKWRPSIHMPRWASRLTLEITNVRVERLQDISEEDTDAEVFGGDYPHTVRPDLFPDFEAAGALSMQECFARVWDDINGKKPGRAWADNPWVWVIEFEQVTP